MDVNTHIQMYKLNAHIEFMRFGFSWVSLNACIALQSLIPKWTDTSLIACTIYIFVHSMTI